MTKSRIDQLKRDYKKYKKDYLSFQREIYRTIKIEIKRNYKHIDIAEIKQRPDNTIKSIKKIIRNICEKKQKYKSIFDYEDIAGVRVICHCDDDWHHIDTALTNYLRQKYLDVVCIEKDEKREQKNNKIDSNKQEINPYRATHLRIGIPIKNGKQKKIFCEVQIKTVMADAWAVQNHKYLYGKEKEGALSDISSAASDILFGCEKLWLFIKKESKRTKNSEVERD